MFKIQSLLKWSDNQINLNRQKLNNILIEKNKVFMEKFNKSLEIDEKEQEKEELTQELLLWKDKRPQIYHDIVAKLEKIKAINEKVAGVVQVIIAKNKEIKVIDKKMMEINKIMADIKHNIKVHQRIIAEKEKEKQLVSNFKELPFHNKTNKRCIKKKQETINENYDFKKLLNKINYQIEIINIFNSIEPKRENIDIIFKKLQKYNKEIEQELNQKNSSSTLLNNKLENITETLNFIKELQFVKTTIFENQFIFDWWEINQNKLVTSLSEVTHELSLTSKEEINNPQDYQPSTSSYQPTTAQM